MVTKNIFVMLACIVGSYSAMEPSQFPRGESSISSSIEIEPYELRLALASVLVEIEELRAQLASLDEYNSAHQYEIEKNSQFIKHAAAEFHQLACIIVHYVARSLSDGSTNKDFGRQLDMFLFDGLGMPTEAYEVFADGLLLYLIKLGIEASGNTDLGMYYAHEFCLLLDNIANKYGIAAIEQVQWYNNEVCRDSRGRS